MLNGLIWAFLAISLMALVAIFIGALKNRHTPQEGEREFTRKLLDSVKRPTSQEGAVDKRTEKS